MALHFMNRQILAKPFRVVALLLLCFLPNVIFGQEVSIKPGKTNIALNEYFTITITLNDADLRNYSNFPEINGFLKAGTSSSSSTNIVNGNISSSQSIIQNYQAKKEGTYTVPAFTMSVNGKNYQAPGFKITVGPSVQRQQMDPFAYDPFEEFFGGRNAAPKEFLDVKEDAFLGLVTDKDKAYVGEGINASLSLYVAENNRAEMDFYQLGQQLPDILKKLKPASAWEENFNIEEIQPKQVSINNKHYTQFKLYQATFFPLNTKPIVFPTVGLKVIKYKVAKTPSFFGQDRQQDFKVFYSKPKVVNIKALPPHPLRDQVSVGNFRLVETINKKAVNTGKSLDYDFKLVGDGNISAVNGPNLPLVENFEFYPPNTHQSIGRSNNKVTGEKLFSYHLIPKEAGNYRLGDYFSWIYFNTSKEKYDTLRSQISISVTGENLKASEIAAAHDNFYDQIKVSSNSLVGINRNAKIKLWANVLLGCVMVTGLVFIFRKGKKEK
jgi:BatD DUF11 like domain